MKVWSQGGDDVLTLRGMQGSESEKKKSMKTRCFCKLFLEVKMLHCFGLLIETFIPVEQLFVPLPTPRWWCDATLHCWLITCVAPLEDERGDPQVEVTAVFVLV